MEDGNLFISKGCCVDKDHSSIFPATFRNDCRRTVPQPAKKSNIISILFGNSFPFAIKNREKKRQRRERRQEATAGEGCGADKYL